MIVSFVDPSAAVRPHTVRSRDEGRHAEERDAAQELSLLSALLRGLLRHLVQPVQVAGRWVRGRRSLLRRLPC